MKKILVNYALPSAGLTELYNNFEVISPKEGRFTREEVMELIPQCHGMLCAGFRVNQQVIDNAPLLEIISNYGAGYDHIDIPYATAKGILVTNIPDTVTKSTAEFTLALILSLARRLTEGDRRLRANVHKDWGLLSYYGFGLEGKTLGIIGMGRIGLRVAQLAQAFGMKIIYNKRSPYSPEEEKERNITFSSVEEILQTADIVSLHCPLTPETHHLLTGKEFKMMKPTAILVNTARGAVVKEDDLVEALQKGTIAGAALDVFEFEPKITQELFNFENVVLTPHIGSATWETRIEMTLGAVEHLVDFFQGKTPTDVVNPEVLKK